MIPIADKEDKHFRILLLRKASGETQTILVPGSHLVPTKVWKSCPFGSQGPKRFPSQVSWKGQPRYSDVSLSLGALGDNFSVARTDFCNQHQ